MPPRSTQNLNAKLSSPRTGRQRPGGRPPGFGSRPGRSPASQTKIVGGPSNYRGGYHLNV